jgi:hypothetical protein
VIQKPTISSPLRKWQILEVAGVCGIFLLRIIAFGLPLLCLYGIADALLALPSASRQIWNILLPVALTVFALTGLRISGSRYRLARALDRFHRDPRRTLSCALDLEQEEDTSAWQIELKSKTISEAVQTLKKIPLRAVIPFRSLVLLLLLSALGYGALQILIQRNPEIVKIVSARIRNPNADIAPWTPLSFTVLPEDLSVRYGDDLLVTVQVEGGDLRHPVMLKIRDQNQALPGFKEAENRFSLRLEQVIEPLEFCFTTGRIRSDWHTVDVQWLPRLTGSSVSLTPPGYSGKATRNYAFGERVLKGYPGTTIDLTLESNRPLGSGEVLLQREGQPAERISATVEGNKAHFSWELNQSAAISVQITDIVGNSMARAVESHQRMIPDTAPEVSLSNPPPFMLATPDRKITIDGSASDDIGITQLTLVRGLKGFIDRPKRIAQGRPESYRGFSETLDLAALGVEPGQTLELYLEAKDHRPDGGRTGVSALSRIRIISNEEYASKLRQAELMDGFRNRFQLASAAMNEVNETLKALQQEIDGSPTRASLQKALDDAAEASRNAEAVFQNLGDDFPIYELEEKAQVQLQALQQHFGKQADALEALTPDDMDLDIQVARITGANQTQQTQMDEIQTEQERFLKLGEVLEQTLKYQELVKRQELLVRWFERYAYALPAESRDDLRRLGEYQEALEEELQDWMKTTEERAGALDLQDADLRGQVSEMIRALEELKVSELMKQTSQAAENEANREALRLARSVLDILKNPDEKKKELEQNGFCQMCKGNAPGEGMGEGLGNSLQQLLDALKSRGSGQGRTSGGGGGGVGGFEDDGYSTQGSSPLHLPTQGPSRGQFDKPDGQMGQGNSNGGSGTGNGTAPGQASGRPGGRSASPTAPAELILEQAPPRYKEAIRTFFDLNQETSL